MKIFFNNQEFSVINGHTFFLRLKGLTFKKNIQKGIYFPKCKSIHTFFMKEKIDLIMINKDLKVIYFKKNVSKNKIIYKKEAYHTIELPINSISNLNIGDHIKLVDD